MRKFIRDIILDILNTVKEAHNVMGIAAGNGNREELLATTDDCQNTAVDLADFIELNEGSECPAAKPLDEYRTALAELYKNVSEGADFDIGCLDRLIDEVTRSVMEIKVKLEVLFLPYKRSMWDSLESIWKAADADPDCDAYVMPIPYYDRKQDHSLGELHYEGGDYPDYVPVMNYMKYNIQARRPDIIYIHNPYDEYNYVTSVHPAFYSSVLKNFTNMLVYVPYYIVEDLTPEVTHFICSTAGVLNADKVIVQYEEKRQSCISYMYNSNKNIEYLNQKFLALGSPKIDAMVNLKREEHPLPSRWQEIIGDRKVIFYNTTISTLLNHGEKFLEKLKNDINFFKERKDLAIWFRPHPLMRTTFESMCPGLTAEYDGIIEDYKACEVGIYDDSADLHRAIAWSDIYYGDFKSSIYMMFCAAGKEAVGMEFGKNGDPNTGYEDDLKLNYTDNSSPRVLELSANPDGTSGEKIHKRIKDEVYGK